MDDLTKGFKAMAVSQCDSSVISHPCHPPSTTAIELDAPRYLFRVYSPKSAGENSTEGFISVDASNTEGDPTDVFARNPEHVAISLNEHLRWSQSRSHPDPFISWTTSLAFAVHYAIYKSKEEGVDFKTIMLCVIDTTKYPPGTFMQDLNLIRIFQSCVPNHKTITVYGSTWSWSSKGLSEFLELRTARKKRGFYYFGEYLSQGRTSIDQDRSCTVSMEKIINDDLYLIVPHFHAELKSTEKGVFQRQRWANAVLDLRQDFNFQRDPSTYLSRPRLQAGYRIACQFTGEFAVVVLASVLSLRPLWAVKTVGAAILEMNPDLVRVFCLEPTKVVADYTIPEVLQLQENIHSIHDACYEDAIKRTAWLSKKIENHLQTRSTAMGGHVSLFNHSLFDWANKVIRDTEDFRRKLDEVERVTGGSLERPFALNENVEGYGEGNQENRRRDNSV